jgi:hypothetical protein
MRSDSMRVDCYEHLSRFRSLHTVAINSNLYFVISVSLVKPDQY